jgi:hypothetical protein
VRLEKTESGELTPVVIYERPKRKKRKATRIFRPADKALRRLAEAQQAFTASYLGRHDASSRRKRDGWLIDLPRNVMVAGRKGAKRLRLSRFLAP